MLWTVDGSTADDDDDDDDGGDGGRSWRTDAGVSLPPILFLFFFPFLFFFFGFDLIRNVSFRFSVF